MSKEKEKDACINIGRIRIRRNMIKQGMDSNLLSTKIIQIQINKNNLLRMNPRRNTMLEKEEDHQSNVEGPNKITYTRISIIEEIKRR
jgi:hypothetical protein